MSTEEQLASVFFFWAVPVVAAVILQLRRCFAALNQVKRQRRALAETASDRQAALLAQEQQERKNAWLHALRIVLLGAAVWLLGGAVTSFLVV